MHTGVFGRRLMVYGPLLLSLLTACDATGWKKDKLPPEPPPKPRAGATADPLVRGTVGQYTLLTSVSPEVLRGFGLVVGLDGRGSNDCPVVIREYITEFLAKQIAPQGSGRRPALTPNQLVNSPDTAVVEVTGLWPAGAVRGTRFDLRVEALPGTAAESIAGGLLLPVELRFFDRAASGRGMLTGAVLAEGGGPVFVNPFAEEDRGATDADPRHGAVLGGGRVVEPRPSRLALIEPRYDIAQAIERRVNERFPGHEPQAAEAMSIGYVMLNTPPTFATRPHVFRRLVAHLYLARGPGVLERRAQELAEIAVGPGADLERVALAWEALGAGVVPHIQRLYAHEDPALRFYAARVGLRLDDSNALPPLANLAAAGPHGLRLLAIKELGMSRSPQAPLKLAPLLSVDDQEARIAAYEALLEHHHPAIESTTFPFALDPSQLNFTLDVVQTTGAPLVYVRRTDEPRIAVFGRQIPLMPPVFYTHPHDALTVLTVEGHEDVRLFVKRNGRLSDEIIVPARAQDVVRALADLPRRDRTDRLRGLGLPYSRVVQVLVNLCRNETIAAPLVFEQQPLAEVLGPEEPTLRPETDPEYQPDEVPAEAPPATDPSLPPLEEDE